MNEVLWWATNKFLPHTTMSRINSDLAYPRGYWNSTTAYHTASAAQPWSDMVVCNMVLNPLAAAVPGFFTAVRDSTNQQPVDAMTQRTVNSSYWQLIRLNQ